MEAHPLDKLVAATLLEVDDLESRDQAGRAYAEVQVRMGYLHDLLRRLEGELAGLRQDSASVPAGKAFWRQTVDDLLAREPDSLRAPAAALVAGDLDLLRLVEYTSASVALVQERRSVLSRMHPPEPPK